MTIDDSLSLNPNQCHYPLITYLSQKDCLRVFRAAPNQLTIPLNKLPCYSRIMKRRLRAASGVTVAILYSWPSVYSKEASWFSDSFLCAKSIGKPFFRVTSLWIDWRANLLSHVIVSSLNKKVGTLWHFSRFSIFFSSFENKMGTLL